MRIISSIALTVLVLTLRVGAIPFESLHTHTPVKPKMVITDSGVDLAISGWVMSNTFWDTRQVVGIQGNDLLFYPAPVKRDPNGDDINAHGEVNLLPIETAFKFELRGPDVGCATSEGLIEMIFFGINEETITLPLLFQGYLQLSWPDYLVSFGQQYSPSFFPVVMPNTVGFSYGAPINSFSVSPQLRFMYHTSIGDMLLAASSSFGSSGE